MAIDGSASVSCVTILWGIIDVSQHTLDLDDNMNANEHLSDNTFAYPLDRGSTS